MIYDFTLMGRRVSRVREVKVGDLFRVIRGKALYTRRYAEAHPGKVPVYSASLAGPMAYGDFPSHRGPLLTFTTNGYGGSVQIVRGEFACNGDRAVLLPRDKAVVPDLRYVARVLEQALRPLAIGRRADGGRNEYTKLSPRVAQEVTIPILVDETGNIHFEAMRVFGEAIESASRLQGDLRSRIEQLASADIVIDLKGPSKIVQLADTETFSTSIGRRVLLQEMSTGGDVPVYSANARKPMGFAREARSGDVFEGPSLIWGIDGVFDWNLIPTGQSFVPTDHCGRLQIRDSSLDPEYLLFALRASRNVYGFNRVFRANLQNIASLEIQVPVDGNGVPDLQEQQNMARRYRRLDTIREDLLAKLDLLTGVVVTPQVVHAADT